MKKIITAMILAILLSAYAAPAASAVYGIPELPGKKMDMPFQKELKEAESKSSKEDSEVDATTLGINLILRKVADGLLYIAAPIAIVFVVWGGSSYIMAMGKQEGLDAAKKTLIWAILGLLLIIMSYALVRLLVTMMTDIATPIPPS